MPEIFQSIDVDDASWSRLGSGYRDGAAPTFEDCGGGDGWACVPGGGPGDPR